MKIHFKGAAQTVTGSQLLIETNGNKILLECGLFQGRRQDYYERNAHFSFNPREIDAVLLSHAHIDHSGNLPNLVKNGYSKPIYATPATVSLADIMLRDSGHIQEADVKFVNKKRARRGDPPLKPLYTIEDAERVNDRFIKIPYDHPFSPCKGITAQFIDAGHILGSAAIMLDIEEDGKKTRLWFSGDIGREQLPLLKDPIFPLHPDYMIMECTYGDKPHRSPEAAFVEFREVVQKTIKRGGKVIIPAFAVGRTQELIYFLNEMMASRDIPAIPVFIDSPLAIQATDVFQDYADEFDEETRAFVKSKKHPALQFPTLKFTSSVKESKAINKVKGPCIIISASGMAETGRILHHLRNNIENPKNTIMIVSWQAPYTLGRRLAEREEVVRIFGQLFERRAEIATIGGLSAHAGQEMLIKYAQAAGPQLKRLFLVHGEADASNALQEKLKGKIKAPVLFPEQFDFVEI